MRHSFRRSLILVLGALLLPVAASAQVLTFATRFTGEVPAADEKLFREALASEAAAIWKGNAKNEAATSALLGSGANCAEASCAAAAGAAVPASAAIAARINDEAEIFDFTITIFSAVDGKALVTENGECTFCSMQEASTAFRATAKSALGKVGTLPTATAGKVVAPAPVIVAAPVVAPPAPTPKPAAPVVAAPAPKPAAPVVAVPAPKPAAPAVVAPAPKPAAPAVVAPAPTPAPTPKPAAAAELERLDAWMKGDKKITIAATPAAASVQVNGQMIGTGTASIQAAPQKLEVTVAAPGYTSYTERLELLSATPGLDLRIALASESAGGVDLESRQFRRSAGWVSASLGLIGAITGAVLLSRDGEPNCAGAVSQCAEIYDLGAAGGMLTAIGGIAFGTGATLLFTTPSEP
ncbi:MAG: PEGA domain-containing protein [Deltaproteobacteria bacterium]|nr:PEGA domain-containing protein [Deltaproteobacteria bacterium]